jgi:hypothetical protein
VCVYLRMLLKVGPREKGRIGRHEDSGERRPCCQTAVSVRLLME